MLNTKEFRFSNSYSCIAQSIRQHRISIPSVMNKWCLNRLSANVEPQSASLESQKLIT